MSKSTICAALAIAVGMFSATAAAHAGGGHHKHHHHHGFNKHLYLYSSPVIVDDCSYEYRRWRMTGSHFWKKSYFVCKGFW